MINQNELRFGNFISRLDLANQSKRIEKIIGLCEKAKTTGPIVVLCDYSDLEPVHLTESWLFRAKFESHFITYPQNEDACKAYSKGCLTLYKRESESLFYSEQGIIVKYVHRLQNLYFELNDSEIIFSNKP